MGIRKKSKLVCGVGTNDASHTVAIYAVIGGRRRLAWQCPRYTIWKNMIGRCYSAAFQVARPTYAGCSVAHEWHLFSAFDSWMRSKSWEGLHLDKDILYPGNKIYGPGTCVFVSREVNSFLTDSGSARGEWPIGVSWQKDAGRFRSKCRNPFTDKYEYLGLFAEPDAAHEAWRKRKHEHACRYADQQTDPRTAQALRTRYATPAGESK